MENINYNLRIIFALQYAVNTDRKDVITYSSFTVALQGISYPNIILKDEQTILDWKKDLPPFFDCRLLEFKRKK